MYFQISLEWKQSETYFQNTAQQGGWKEGIQLGRVAEWERQQERQADFFLLQLDS